MHTGLLRHPESEMPKKRIACVHGAKKMAVLVARLRGMMGVKCLQTFRKTGVCMLLHYTSKWSTGKLAESTQHGHSAGQKQEERSQIKIPRPPIRSFSSGR